MPRGRCLRERFVQSGLRFRIESDEGAAEDDDRGDGHEAATSSTFEEGRIVELSISV